ncbi:hypothetical protein PFISCL1PPCAC_7337, partial [Pristionchus fissidentatus]
EKKWGAKFSEMRNIHTPVRKYAPNLLFDLRMSTKYTNSEQKHNHIQSQISKLLESLKAEIVLMRRELSELERMKVEHPEALFLHDIEDSATSIEKASIRFSTCADEIRREMVNSN